MTLKTGFINKSDESGHFHERMRAAPRFHMIFATALLILFFKCALGSQMMMMKEKKVDDTATIKEITTIPGAKIHQPPPERTVAYHSSAPARNTALNAGPSTTVITKKGPFTRTVTTTANGEVVSFNSRYCCCFCPCLYFIIPGTEETIHNYY